MSPKTTTRRLALESKEARYRSAFEYAPVRMALVIPIGCYIAVNHALCQPLSYNESEMLAMSWLDLTPPDAYEAELAQVTQKMLSGELRAHRSRLCYRHKQGHKVYGLNGISRWHVTQIYEPLYFICEIVESQPSDDPLAQNSINTVLSTIFDTDL